MMEKLNMQTTNIVDENIKRIGELFPNCLTGVSDGYLMACFDEEVNETTITEIACQQPYYFVMRDSSLANDQVADNFEQIWEEYSKDTVRRIL